MQVLSAQQAASKAEAALRAEATQAQYAGKQLARQRKEVRSMFLPGLGTKRCDRHAAALVTRVWVFGKPGDC